jgi:HEPN domain-containing protein
MEEIIKLLEKRSQDFLTDAEIDLKEGRYDISAFHAEQAIQLLIKAKILEFGVQFPKTHSISKLLELLAKLKNDKRIKALAKTKETRELEEVYISSRYFPFPVSKVEAKNYLKFAKKVKSVLSK